MACKKRLDQLLIDREIASTKEDAHRLIESGLVRVNGIIRKNINSQQDERVKISLHTEKKFVGRGGDKLQGALKDLNLVPENMICLDIGSSTGGFTDCLLQNGAQRVYAVDVGYGILDWKLRSDSRVVVLERTNARFLTKEIIKDRVDLCVIDASFISLDLLLAPVIQFFEGEVRILALVKPQFQLPQHMIEEGGVVRDSHLHQEALEMVKEHAGTLGLKAEKTVSSVIKGAKGNQEFFMFLRNCN